MAVTGRAQRQKSSWAISIKKARVRRGAGSMRLLCSEISDILYS